MIYGFVQRALLITFVLEESFPGDDLTDEVPVVTAPFATGEFYCAVFVNTVYAAIITDSCTFTWFETGHFLW